MLFNVMAVSWSSIWEAFSSAFGSVVDFVMGNTLLLTLIAFPIGVAFVSVFVKAFRP